MTDIVDGMLVIQCKSSDCSKEIAIPMVDALLANFNDPWDAWLTKNGWITGETSTGADYNFCSKDCQAAPVSMPVWKVSE
jgi:hypothetical protein